jgi:hypothetical protein
MASTCCASSSWASTTRTPVVSLRSAADKKRAPRREEAYTDEWCAVLYCLCSGQGLWRHQHWVVQAYPLHSRRLQEHRLGLHCQRKLDDEILDDQKYANVSQIYSPDFKSYTVPGGAVVSLDRMRHKLTQSLMSLLDDLLSLFWVDAKWLTRRKDWALAISWRLHQAMVTRWMLMTAHSSHRISQYSFIGSATEKTSDCVSLKVRLRSEFMPPAVVSLQE